MIRLSIVGEKPTPLEVYLASALPRLLYGLRNGASLFSKSRVDPDAYVWLLYGLCAAWLVLYMAFGFALLGIWGALRGLNLVGYFDIPAFEFGAGVCVIGAADCGWRVMLAWIARKRYLRDGRQLDARGRWLMKIALANDATILLQIAGGVLFAMYG